MVMGFVKVLYKCYLICMKMKLVKNIKYLQQTFYEMYIYNVQETATDFTSRISKSYVPFTCVFPMVMDFVLVFTSAVDKNMIFLCF